MAGSGTAHLRDDGPETVIRVEHLTVEFPAAGGKTVHAVSDLSIDVLRGETLGLVGESGCGKSSLGRAIMQYPRPTSGQVQLNGAELTHLKGNELRGARAALQLIFQDPVSSLNPRRRVREIVVEGLQAWPDRTPASSVEEMLSAVGLNPDAVASRRPHELSGGQCQRVSIARALMMEPEVLICDEPVASLDVSVQAQILNLLHEMKDYFSLTMIFIAHDLAVVKIISDRIAVMYLGKLCEVGPADEMYERPLHPYTRVLVDAAPVPDPTHQIERSVVYGDVPSPIDPPKGCRFHTRCPIAQERCRTEEPVMREVLPGRFVACHFPLGFEQSEENPVPQSH